MGLEQHRKYSFRVRAENQYGTSEPLDTIEPIVAKFPFTVPDAPGMPMVTDHDTSNISLIWDKPKYDGGSIIQGYRIECRDVEDGQWRVVNDYLLKDTAYTAFNLSPKHEYEFRVRAKNAAGFSKPSDFSSKCKIKSKISVPGAPGTPKVTKVGKRYADLTWQMPTYDGGSKITGYMIEKREIGSAGWSKCNDYNILTTEFTALNLNDKSEYEFRIYAVNSAGKSEPSNCSTPVKICEVQDGKEPEWIRGLSNQCVPLGKPYTFSCEATGSPIPTCRWLRNGREIVSSGRFKVEDKNGRYSLHISEVWDQDNGEYSCEAVNVVGCAITKARLKIGTPPQIEKMPSDLSLVEGENHKLKIYFTGDQPMNLSLKKNGSNLQESSRLKFTIFDDYVIIFVRDVTKDDIGDYQVTLTNSLGSASGNVNINVTGLPGQCTGPLNVSNITDHTCLLSWKPPKYDGGLKINRYIIERNDLSNPHWIAISSLCKDVSFNVQGLCEGQVYKFRVSAANANGAGIPLEGENSVKAKLPFSKLIFKIFQIAYVNLVQNRVIF